MSLVDLTASFNSRTLRGEPIVFKSAAYPPDLLASMGWRWIPTLRYRSRIQCSHCSLVCDVQQQLSEFHLQQSPSCPLATIWEAKEHVFELEGEQVYHFWFNNDTFSDPKSQSAIEARINTFPSGLYSLSSSSSFSSSLRKSTDLVWCDNPDAPSISSLVSNGFYYNPIQKNDDRCTCMYCGVHLLEWELGDDVEIEHARESDQCYVWKYEILKERQQRYIEQETVGKENEMPDFYHDSPSNEIPDFGHDVPEIQNQLESTPPKSKPLSAGTNDDPIDLDEEGNSSASIEMEIVEPDELEDFHFNVNSSSPNKNSPSRKPAFPSLKSTDLSEFFTELDVDSDINPRNGSYFQKRKPEQKNKREEPVETADNENFGAFDGFEVPQNDDDYRQDDQLVTNEPKNDQEQNENPQLQRELENSSPKRKAEAAVEATNDEALGVYGLNILDDNRSDKVLKETNVVNSKEEKHEREHSVEEYYDATEIPVEEEEEEELKEVKNIDDAGQGLVAKETSVDRDRVELLENELEILRKQVLDLTRKSLAPAVIEEPLEIADTYEEFQIKELSEPDKSEPIFEKNDEQKLSNHREEEQEDDEEAEEEDEERGTSKKRTKEESKEIKRLKKKRKLERRLKKHMSQSKNTTDDLLHLGGESEREVRKRLRRERKERKKLKRAPAKTQLQARDILSPVAHFPSAEANLGEQHSAMTPSQQVIPPVPSNQASNENVIKLTVGEENTEEVSPTLQKSLGRGGESKSSLLALGSSKLESLNRLMMLSPVLNKSTLGNDSLSLSAFPALPAITINSSSHNDITGDDSNNKTGADSSKDTKGSIFNAIKTAPPGTFVLEHSEIMDELIQMGQQSTPHCKPVKDVVGTSWQRIDGAKYELLYKDLVQAGEYVKEVVDSEYDTLSDDLTGLLTGFVGELGPEQMKMTIREWVLHQQQQAEALVRSRSHAIANLFAQDWKTALETLTNMSTC